MGTFVDLLLQKNGIGEMRLLAPALRTMAERRVVLLQPPHAAGNRPGRTGPAAGIGAVGLRRAHWRHDVGGRAGPTQRKLPRAAVLAGPGRRGECSG